MIKSVVLDKTDTCLTYALKRIDCFDVYPIDYDKLTNGQIFEVLSYDKTILIKGDILLWDKWDVRSVPTATEITKERVILYHTIFQGFHCGIYEDKDLVSDCSQEQFYPYLRLRVLSEMKKPDKILRKRL